MDTNGFPWSELLSGGGSVMTALLLYRVSKLEKAVGRMLEGPTPLPERVAVCENDIEHLQTDVAGLKRR